MSQTAYNLLPQDAPADHAEDASLEERATVELADGASYTGQWKGSQCHGQGELVRSDGSGYKGQFRHGRADGEGTFTAANGNEYKGQWVNDSAHGEGTYLHADGSSYKGQWVYDQKTGKGVEKWADGSAYVGQFLNGNKHGQGGYVNEEGKMAFCGNFTEDKLHGYGAYTFKDGRIYLGQFECGQMQGIGHMTWANGSTYFGNYVEQLRSGFGTLSWPDGRRYEGIWEKGKQHGQGWMGDSCGIWEQGQQKESANSPPPLHKMIPIDRILRHAAVVWIGMPSAGLASLPWADCNGNYTFIAVFFASPLILWAVWDENQLLTELNDMRYKPKAFKPSDPEALSGKDIKAFMQERSLFGSKGVLGSLAMMKFFSFLDSMDLSTDTAFPALVRSCGTLITRKFAESFEPIPVLGGYISDAIYFASYFGVTCAALVIGVYLLQGAHGAFRLLSLRSIVRKGGDIEVADVAYVADFASMQAVSKLFADIAEDEAISLSESPAEPGELRNLAAMVRENVLAVRAQMSPESDDQRAEFERLLKEAAKVDTEADGIEDKQKRAESDARNALTRFLVDVIGRKVLSENVIQMELQSSFTVIRASSTDTPITANLSLFISVCLGAASAASKTAEAIKKARKSPDRFLRGIVAVISLAIFASIIHVFLKLGALAFCDSKILSVSEGGCLRKLEHAQQ